METLLLKQCVPFGYFRTQTTFVTEEVFFRETRTFFLFFWINLLAQQMLLRLWANIMLESIFDIFPPHCSSRKSVQHSLVSKPRSCRLTNKTGSAKAISRSIEKPLSQVRFQTSYLEGKIKRLSSNVKLDWFVATLFPMSSLSLNLSGLVRAQMVRLLNSAAFRMTRFIALSPVGSPTSDTITMMLLVFFSMYSSTKLWVTWFIRGSSLAKWAPGRSTKVRVVSSGPVH